MNVPTPENVSLATLKWMGKIIETQATRPGDFPTLIDDLSVYRRNEPCPPVTCMVEPSIVVVVQGAKQMVIGGDAYPYDTGSFLVTCLNLPAHSAVIEASEQAPCLGLLLKLDLRTLAELIAQDDQLQPPAKALEVSAGVGTVTPHLLSSLGRLIDLLQEPKAVPVIWPLLQREIHYRLLMTDQAPLLRHIASIGSKGHRIGRAIDWIKLNYALPLRVEDLAEQVRMGLSTFHQHFRLLTAMSPLQYQKWIRLNEARRMMLNENLDAATAAFKVGYESPSQFSREYGRQFGAPPKRDIGELRRTADKR